MTKAERAGGEAGVVMGWPLFFQLIGTLAIAAAGGWLGHFLSARRDAANERRKLIVTYLLEAYRRLEKASNHDEPDQAWQQIESAVADVQLLGSTKQVELARAFALGMQQNGTAPLDPLILDLRKSLRAELGLSEVNAKVVYMRYRKGD